MDEIENKPLNFYEAKLTFRKKVGEEKIVSVTIRYTKRGHARKRDFSSEEMKELFEKKLIKEGIKDSDLRWTRYHGEDIAVYHRREKDDYVSRFIAAPTGLGQKLEKLVSETNERLTKTSR